jgi:hypothetical protein
MSMMRILKMMKMTQEEDEEGTDQINNPSLYAHHAQKNKVYTHYMHSLIHTIPVPDNAML